MAATEAPKLRKDGTPRKAPEKGVVESDVIEVTEIPKFERASGGTRTSDIDLKLAELAKSLAPGKTVAVRQYSKKESANGTLYNLRARYNGTKNTPSEHQLKGIFEFAVGPMDSLGKPGMTGLFVTRTNGKVAK